MLLAIEGQSHASYLHFDSKTAVHLHKIRSLMSITFALSEEVGAWCLNIGRGFIRPQIYLCKSVF